MIWNHKEKSIKDLTLQYNVRSTTNIWVHYEMNDKIVQSYDDDPMRLDTGEEE